MRTAIAIGIACLLAAVTMTTVSAQTTCSFQAFQTEGECVIGTVEWINSTNVGNFEFELVFKIEGDDRIFIASVKAGNAEVHRLHKGQAVEFFATSAPRHEAFRARHIAVFSE